MRSTRLPSWSKRLFGLDPVAAPPHVFRIVGHELLYARIAPSGAGYVVEDFRRAPLEANLFGDGPLGGPMHDPEQLRSRLTRLQQELPEPIREASLVLPDSWLRLAFLEDEEAEGAAANEEILRWKLQRIVPFRVEELRVRSGGEVTRVPGTGQIRMPLGFALEALVGQLETCFNERGIRIGIVSNASMSMLPALRGALRDVELGGTAFVSPAGYSLTFVWRGQPVLHRFKALPQLAGDEPPEHLIQRDLRLTRIYLGERLGSEVVGRILLVCPHQLENRWQERLGTCFEVAVHPVRPEYLPLAENPAELALDEVVPLLGAVLQEVT